MLVFIMVFGPGKDASDVHPAAGRYLRARFSLQLARREVVGQHQAPGGRCPLAPLLSTDLGLQRSASRPDSGPKQVVQPLQLC